MAPRRGRWSPAGRRSSASAARPDPSDVARTLDRVGAVVGAGISAPRAWRIVAAREPALTTLDRALAAGASPARAIGLVAPAGSPWADVAAICTVAERTGAPVGPALRALAFALRDAAGSERSVRVALAGPRTSGRVVLALPAFGVALGSAWGADALAVLVGSPIGWSCSGLAIGLVLVARSWTERLVRAATPDRSLPGTVLEAWAVALGGGGSWTSAGRAVRAAFGDRAVPDDERRRLAETLDLARSAGVPAAAMLRSAAEDVRREAAADAIASAERLGVRLVLPLGVCVLPAFVLVGVVPVVVGVLSSTTGSLP